MCAAFTFLLSQEKNGLHFFDLKQLLTMVQFQRSKDIKLPVRKNVVILSFTYFVLHSFFLCGDRYQAFINRFLTIHEILTRGILAKMRLACQKGREIYRQKLFTKAI